MLIEYELGGKGGWIAFGHFLVGPEGVICVVEVEQKGVCWCCCWRKGHCSSITLTNKYDFREHVKKQLYAESIILSHKLSIMIVQNYYLKFFFQLGQGFVFEEYPIVLAAFSSFL